MGLDLQRKAAVGALETAAGEDFGPPGGDGVAQPQGLAERAGVADILFAEAGVAGDPFHGLLDAAAVARACRQGEEGAARMVQTHQRGGQDAVPGVAVAVVRMVDPAGVGNLAGRPAQARPFPAFLREEAAGPGGEPRSEAGEAAEALTVGGCPGEQRIGAPRPQVESFVKHPLADAARGEDDLRRPGDADQAAQHDRRRPHRLDPPDRDRRKPLQPPLALAGQKFREIGELHGSGPVPVDHPERPVVLRHMHLGQRAPRTADGIERLASRAGKPVDFGQRLLDRSADRFALRHGLVEAQRAERQGRHLVGLLAADPDELQAAAAQVADDALGPGKAGHDAVGRKAGLVLAAQHPDFEARIAPQRLDEGRAVRRLAHGRGRKGRQARHLHGGGRTDEAAQVRPGLDDAVRVEPAGGAQAAAQPAHHLLVEDRNRRAGRPLEHHKADGIGADVDDGDPPPEIIVRCPGFRAGFAAVRGRADRQYGDVTRSETLRGSVFGEAGGHSGAFPQGHPLNGILSMASGRRQAGRRAPAFAAPLAVALAVESAAAAGKARIGHEIGMAGKVLRRTPGSVAGLRAGF